ncbi:MAG: hypothetical protein J6U28_00685 [Bacteroidales bacterium]|nr:hypothetical protein [Bacteroidales bacterium]
MIKEYNLIFYGPSSTTTDQELYERYVDQIHQVLVDCGLFTSVVKNKPSELPETNPYEAYYVEAFIDDDRVLRFELTGEPNVIGSGTNANKSLNKQQLRMYYANGDYSIRAYPTTTGWTNTTGYGFRKAYVTSNGVFFRFFIYYASSGGVTRSGYSAVVIAKSNKRCPIVIAPIDTGNGSYSSTRYSTLVCHQYGIASVNYEDPGYLSSTTTASYYESRYNYATTGKQTMLFPFLAGGDTNYDYSYSKYACWMPYAPNSIRNGGLQKVLVNGKAYIIDGYFALRDD